jgi:hypothetical protein
MGNTGVASADYLVAPFYNPALTAMFRQSDDVGLLLPAVEVGVRDSDETLEVADELQDLMDRYSDNLTGAQVSDLDTLNSYLDDLDNNKPLTVAGGAGIAVAVPTNTVAVNVFMAGHVEVIGATDIDDTDPSNADPLIYATNTQARIEASYINLYAFGYTEFGVAFAKQMQLGGHSFSIGVAPKYQELTTYSQSERVNEFDVDDYDQSEVTDSGFNLDLGAVWYRDAWRAGLALKDLFSQEIKTKTGGKTYELKPQATVAAAYTTELFTAAVDIDLTKQTRFTNTDDDTQFIRFGVEGNAWGWAQLRAGYEIDTQDTMENAITAGIGLSPWDVVSLDIAGSYADENEFGGSANLAFTF